MSTNSSSSSSCLFVRDLRGDYRQAEPQEVLHAALRILGQRVRRGATLSSPQCVKDFLKLRLSTLEHEVFAILMLDTRHRMIEYKELFRGTIDGASVYTREVVKECLACNAAAVIFTHNHPSGLPDESQADVQLTRTLKQALALIDVRALDHIIVGGDETLSFAERGLL